MRKRSLPSTDRFQCIFGLDAKSEVSKCIQPFIRLRRFYIYEQYAQTYSMQRSSAISSNMAYAYLALLLSLIAGVNSSIITVSTPTCTVQSMTYSHDPAHTTKRRQAANLTYSPLYPKRVPLPLPCPAVPNSHHQTSLLLELGAIVPLGLRL